MVSNLMNEGKVLHLLIKHYIHTKQYHPESKGFIKMQIDGVIEKIKVIR